MKKGHDDGHGHGHGEEGRGHESEDKGESVEDTESGGLVPDLHKKESGEEGEEGEGEPSQDQGEEKSEDASDDAGSESDGEKQDETPDTSDDEQLQNTAHETDSGKNVEGVQFKGPTSGGTEEGEQGDTRKHIPDAKGGSKKRIESDYGNRLGAAGDDESKNDDDSEDPTEKVGYVNFFRS